MVTTIIVHELKNQLKSLKFVIGLIITLVLMLVCLLVNIEDFKQRNENYVSANEEMTGDRFYVKVFKAPEVLSVLVQGKDRIAGNSAEMTITRLPSGTTGYFGQGMSRHTRYFARFKSADVAFVVRIILSLLVIFMTYNIVSGEKRNGTLKLILSNEIPRYKLLLGKAAGIVTAVFIPFALAMILSVIVMLIDSSVALGGEEMMRIVFLAGTSFCYLLCFLFLTMLISVVIDNPPVSLMAVLQIWIFTVLIYPNLGIVIAENVFRLPSPEQIADRKIQAFEPHRKEYDSLRDDLNRAVETGVRLTPEHNARRIDATAGKAWIEHSVDMEYDNQLSRQARLADYIAFPSPSVLFDDAMRRFARTDIVSHEKFIVTVENYWREHVERSKLRFTDREAYNKSVLPDFSFDGETLSESLMYALPRLGLLSFYSILFFSMSFACFMRKDVR